MHFAAGWSLPAVPLCPKAAGSAFRRARLWYAGKSGAPSPRGAADTGARADTGAGSGSGSGSGSGAPPPPPSPKFTQGGGQPPDPYLALWAHLLTQPGQLLAVGGSLASLCGVAVAFVAFLRSAVAGELARAASSQRGSHALATAGDFEAATQAFSSDIRSSMAEQFSDLEETIVREFGRTKAALEELDKGVQEQNSKLDVGILVGAVGLVVSLVLAYKGKP